MKRTFSQIKWALDVNSGKLVMADRAERKPGKGRYRCLDPACSRDLTVARTKNGRQHFKHFRNSHPDTCVFYRQRGPQIQHTAAKILLCARINEALNCHMPMPLLQFDTPNGTQFVLPFFTANRVVNEWTCPGGNRRADLAVLDAEGRPALLIEVWHTSAVNRDKQQDLLNYCWIELEAGQVLLDPSVLRVRNHGNLPCALALAWEQFKLFGVTTPSV